MKHPDPRYLKPVLLVLVILSVWGFIRQMGLEPALFREKWALRYLCLMVVSIPTFVLSLLKRRALPTLRICFALSLMAYLLARGAIDIDAMLGAGERWPWLVLGILLVMTMPLIGAIRWRWLLAVQEIDLSFVQSLRLILAGSFFNTCLPGATGGDIFRAYAISKGTNRTAEALTSVFLDRISGLAALIGLSALSVVINLNFIASSPKIREVVIFMLVILCFAGTILICLFSRRVAGWLRTTWLARRNFPGRCGLGRAFQALHAYHGSRIVLLWIWAISLLSHLGTIGAAWAFNHALGVEGISFQQLLLIVPLGLAVNSIPLSPGGVGQGQQAFNSLYTWTLGAGAGAMGGAVMTFIHIGMYCVSLIGAVVYATGYHDLHEALDHADEIEDVLGDTIEAQLDGTNHE